MCVCICMILISYLIYSLLFDFDKGVKAFETDFYTCAVDSKKATGKNSARKRVTSKMGTMILKVCRVQRRL